MASNKKVTGTVELSLTAMVTEVTFTANGHAKHALGYALEATEEEKNYQNWQVFTYAKEDKEAQVYPVGTVLQIHFKWVSLYTSESGGQYLTPGGFPDIRVVKWGKTEENDATPQPATDNKKKGKNPPAPEPVTDDWD